MGKTAFVFPGQGAQTIGMGKEFYDHFSESRTVFETAQAASGMNLSEVCFNGPEEVLKDTRNAQPGILTASIAAFKALEREGIRPDFVAGHSLGEYSALVAAGALSLEEAVKLVVKRSQLMAGADPGGNGSMAAILGLDRDTLKECLDLASSTGRVEAANFNCPGQIVVSGQKTGLTQLQELVAARGGKYIPLNVSGPFHSSFMKPAADVLKPDLEAANWRNPEVPVIANVSAQPVASETLADSLMRQIYSSVLWEDSIGYLTRAGVTVFVEVGPGKVLSGLIKKCAKEATIVNCEDLNTMKKALAILKEV